MDVFDTGNPDATAYFQELVSKDESHISAGFLIIENSKFDWELTYECKLYSIFRSFSAFLL